MTDWFNVILQGVLVGGVYAMFAAGLSLIFGVMRLVNIAHGDLIVLAAYIALVTTETLGIGPLASCSSSCRSWRPSVTRYSNSCSTARWERICCRRSW